MATVIIKHASLTAAAANPAVLVDGPKWDASHTVTGLENVPNVDTSNADNITGGSQTGSGAMVRALNPTFPGSIAANTINTNSTNPLTGSAGVPVTVNGITVQVDQLDVGANTVRGFNLYHNFGSSSAKGSRIGSQFTLQQSSPTNASNAARNYTGLMVLAISDQGDGGTAGTPLGSYWAFNPFIQLGASATNVNEASGIELNTDMHTGSSVLDKYGVKVVQMPTDTVAGSRNDAAFVASNNSGAVGWATLFQVGDGVFQNPLKATGSILSIKGSPTIANGIDLSGAGTISGSAFKSPGFAVAGSGGVALGVGAADPGVGNVNLAGGQIVFPATQNPSSNANTLDDYEEGAGTPTLSFGGASVGITYSVQTMKYTKIGNVVWFNIVIVLTSKGSSTGAALITGLPFTPVEIAPCVFVSNNGAAGLSSISAWAAAGTVTVLPLKYAAGAITQLADTDFTNTTSLRFSGSYQVS